MSGADVQAVYRRHETVADQRLKATTDAETIALEAQCGPKPHMSPVDGPASKCGDPRRRRPLRLMIVLIAFR